MTLAVRESICFADIWFSKGKVMILWKEARYLDDSTPVHYDAAFRILAQLFKSPHCWPLHNDVMWSQVLYHRFDSSFITEALGIVAPFAAHSDSFSQVTPQTYVSLEKWQKMDSDNRHVVDATSSSKNDHCMCTLYRKPLETLHFWANKLRIHTLKPITWLSGTSCVQ